MSADPVLDFDVDGAIAAARSVEMALSPEERERHAEVRRIARADAERAERDRTFAPVTIEAFLEMALPPREGLLAPWLTRRSVSMIYARRGVGKTWLAQSIALAVASAGRVFDETETSSAWEAPAPHEVLHVDGEMPGAMLQGRFRSLIAGRRYAPGGRLRVLAADMFREALPSMSSPEGLAVIEAHIGRAELVVFDNISTLFRGLDENDAAAWQPVEDFLRELRRRNRAVLLVHHSGKSGAQRGTSKREDVLDNVLQLSRRDDHIEEEGAALRVVFDKARGIMGRDVAPFMARVVTVGPGTSWRTSPDRDEVDDEIVRLKAAGKSQAQIAAKVGLDQANVSRRLKRLKAPGPAHAAPKKASDAP